MAQTKNCMYKKKHVSSKLDTDPGEGIINKLKFAAKQLKDRIHLFML